MIPSATKREAMVTLLATPFFVVFIIEFVKIIIIQISIKWYWQNVKI
jgi:hypothetical protein